MHSGLSFGVIVIVQRETPLLLILEKFAPTLLLSGLLRAMQLKLG